MYKKIFHRILLFFYFFIFSCLAVEDEIVFFNVGQGHCALVHKVGSIPLLVDAGSLQNVLRVEDGHEFNRTDAAKGEKVIRDVIVKITEYWKTSPNSLNVIITHADKDHSYYVSEILPQLARINNNFECYLLLGGLREHYGNRFNHPSYHTYYSSDYSPGLYDGSQFLFLDRSNCVKHVFCPKGTKKTNGWSIITRVVINQHQRSFSAIFTGDASFANQQAMLQALSPNRYGEIQTDILLFPHHGSESLHPQWIFYIDPRVVIISAGKREGYNHPQGTALLSLFRSSPNTLVGQMQQLTLTTSTCTRPERFWNRTDSHRIVYYDPCTQVSTSVTQILPTINDVITYRDPNDQTQQKTFVHQRKPFEFSEEPWFADLWGHWKCAVLNFPIYTLYTSGTMVFKHNEHSQLPYEIQFLDIPTDVELMAQEMQTLYMDDKIGDYEDFCKLSSQVQKQSLRVLQQRQSLAQAQKVFFLCFNTIPGYWTDLTARALREWRNANLSNDLGIFLCHTRNLDFNDVPPTEKQVRDYWFLKEILPSIDAVKMCVLFQYIINNLNKRFFDHVVDILFARYTPYEDTFDMVKGFEKRLFIFESLFNSTHLTEVTHRTDLFYIYYLAYSTLKHVRPLFYHADLTNLVQNVRTIPSIHSENENPSSCLEKCLPILDYFYYQCSGSTSYYNTNLTNISELAWEIYNSQIDEQSGELMANLICWLPRFFSPPLHLIIRKLVPFLPKLKLIADENETFEPFGNDISLAIANQPPLKHLDILEIILNRK